MSICLFTSFPLSLFTSCCFCLYTVHILWSRAYLCLCLNFRHTDCRRCEQLGMLSIPFLSAHCYALGSLFGVFHNQLRLAVRSVFLSVHQCFSCLCAFGCLCSSYPFVLLTSGLRTLVPFVPPALFDHSNWSVQSFFFMALSFCSPVMAIGFQLVCYSNKHAS